jgi:hypothetical protein
MSTNNPPSAPPEIFCPECKNRLSSELVGYLLNGTTVYCDRCGFAYTGIEQGEVKPFQKEDKFRGKDDEMVQKLKDQWGIWKNKWQEIKKKYNTPSNNSPNTNINSQPFSQSPSQSSSPNSQPIPNYYSSVSSSPIISPPITPSQQNHYKKEAGKLYDAVLILNKIALVVYLITFLASLGTFIFHAVNKDAAAFLDLSAIILTILVSKLDTNRFIPQIERKMIPNLGISLIIVGGFISRAYGIGIFLIVRGILLIISSIFTILATNNESITQMNQDQKTTWIVKQVLDAYIPYLGLLMKVTFVVLLFDNLGTYAFANEELIPLTIMGFITMMIFTSNVLSKLEHGLDNHRIEDGTIVGCFVLGIFMSSLEGLGVMAITLGILLIVYREMKKKVPNPLPTYEELISASPSRSMPSPSNLGDAPTVRIRRYDPSTGQPYLEPIIDSTLKSHPIESPIITPPPITPPKPIETIPSAPIQNPEIYTVLDNDVRNLLLRLPVSESERTELAKALLYLAKKEQLKYLSQLEIANAIPSKEEKAYLERIQRLPLPEDQKKFLIEQLEYIPPTKQAEYITFLEASVQPK